MLPLVKLPSKVSTQPFVHPYQTLDRIGHRCLHAVLPRLSRGISLHELAGWLLLRMRILSFLKFLHAFLQLVHVLRMAPLVRGELTGVV